MIQQAIAQVLTPIFDPTFSDNSFGFRPNRNGQQAVKQVQGIIETAVDVDLSKFFDRVNHDLLMTHLGYKVKDKRVLRLIKRYLRAGVIDPPFTVKVGKVSHKAGRYRRCWPTSGLILWTKNWRDEITGLLGMRMILPFW